MYNVPSIQDFKDTFVRDFPYSADPTLGVTDADIINAYHKVNNAIMPGYYHSQEIYTQYYLLLAAHYVVSSLQTAAGGAGGSGSIGFIASKSVAGVSTSYSIPQKYLDNPQWGYLASTRYGAEYLAFLIPQLIGGVFTVPGSTRA